MGKMRRFRPFGDNRGICRVRTPKLSFKFSISMAHRDPTLTFRGVPSNGTAVTFLCQP